LDTQRQKASRRRFLKRVAILSSATVVAPNILFGKTSGDKVNLACVGIGNRGAEIIIELHKTGLANIVALCDVDMGAPHTKKIIDLFPDVPRFKDFRSMFDKMGNQIEAVSIGTPDHSHFPVTMMAMALGKHVYVEKPLGRTFQECELLLKASRKYPKVVTQMGNQGHSEENYFQFKAWKEAGIIKDVTAIDAHMNLPRRWHTWDVKMKSFPPAEPIPDTFNWDEWLSAARSHAYNKDYVNGQWRCWYDYGMGALGDWGAHILDTAHEFLALGLPTEIDPVKLVGHNKFFFPMASTIAFKFDARENMPPVTLTWYDGVDNLPPIPEGFGVSGLDPNIPPPSTGAIEPVKLNPGKIIYSKDTLFKGGSHASPLSIIPEAKAKDMQSRLPYVPQTTSNHFKNFLLACMGEEQTRSPFSVAVPLCQVFNLGVLAQQLNKKLVFNPAAKKITNSKSANKLLAGPAPRKGWEQYYVV